MRILIFLLFSMFIFGCAVKPEKMIQGSHSLEVSLSGNSSQHFKVIDRNNYALSEAKASNKLLTFALPYYTSESECYRVVDDSGNNLLGERNGIRLTTAGEYRQVSASHEKAKQKAKQLEKTVPQYLSTWKSADSEMREHYLFSGTTCNLPPQRDFPPFPEVLCNTEGQCQRLANDVCISNLVDAEKCSFALSKTNLHSSISSVSCGIVVASAQGGGYGIDSGLADALTGYLDERTKSMIDSGQYGEAIGTAILRVGLTYLRTQSCKESFAKNAYAPVRSWQYQKARIEKEPYEARDRCYRLIGAHNNALENYETSKTELKQTELAVRESRSELSRLINTKLDVQQCKI